MVAMKYVLVFLAVAAVLIGPATADDISLEELAAAKTALDCTDAALARYEPQAEASIDDLAKASVEKCRASWIDAAKISAAAANSTDVDNYVDGFVGVANRLFHGSVRLAVQSASYTKDDARQRF